MSVEVVVVSETDITVTQSGEPTVVVEVPATPITVEVQVVGAQGPAGDGVSYVHTQSSPASTWTINHNLGLKPSTTVFDTGGNEVEADVQNVSLNQTVINFITAVAGSARLL